MLAFTCVYMVAKNYIIAFFQKLCFCGCWKQKEGDNTEKEELRSQDFYKDLNPTFLLNLFHKAKEELIEVKNMSEFKPKQLDDGRWKRLEEESRFESDEVISKFEYRLSCIMNTIDWHIMSLHGDDSISKFKDLTYESKIEYILDSYLMANKKDDRLRMVGTTQSYNLFDSLAFNSNKKLV